MKYIIKYRWLILGFTQFLTVFGMLMFLFLKMVVSQGMGYTLIDLMNNLGDNFWESGFVPVFVFFIIAMLFAFIDLMCILSELAKKEAKENSFYVTMATIGLLIAIAMLVSYNCCLGNSLGSYASSYAAYYSTEYGGAIAVNAISLGLTIVYSVAEPYIITALKKAKTAAKADQQQAAPATSVAQPAAAPAAQPKAKDDMNAIEAIKAYKQLLDEGAITEEEFQKKKEELM